MENFSIVNEVEFEKRGESWIGDITYRINNTECEDTFLIDETGKITSKYDELNYFTRFEKGREFLNEIKIVHSGFHEVVKTDTFTLINEEKITNIGDIDNIHSFLLLEPKNTFLLKGLYSVQNKNFNNGLSLYGISLKDCENKCTFTFSDSDYQTLHLTIKKLLKKESVNRVKMITNGGDFWNE